MTVEDAEILALFDRAVRPMRTALADDVLGEVRQTHSPVEVRSVASMRSP